jgi:hypothetical protein
MKINKDVVGSIWPNYGAVTGEGSYGRTVNPDKAAENDAEKAKRKHEERMRELNNVDMKKGGRVRTASQRADGIAIRGKTRA